MISEGLDVRQIIASNVKRLRENRGLSVIEAAEQLGVGRQYWYLIEKGDANVTLDKLSGVANILGVEVHDLMRSPKSRGNSNSKISAAKRTA